MHETYRAPEKELGVATFITARARLTNTRPKTTPNRNQCCRMSAGVPGPLLTKQALYDGITIIQQGVGDDPGFGV